jgi:hypothetical protein
MVALKLFGIILSMLFASTAAFVSLLYSYSVIWAAAFAFIIASPSISFVKNGKIWIILCVIFSLFINANFILQIPYGDPVLSMIMYSMLLIVFTFSMLYATMRLTHSLKESRR